MNELEEHSEVIFIQEGAYDIGFEVNGHHYFAIRYTNSAIGLKSSGLPIGQYGCSLNKQSRFNYKASSNCEGYFIRKHKWVKTLKNNTIIAESWLPDITKQQMRTEKIIYQRKR